MFFDWRRESVCGTGSGPGGFQKADILLLLVQNFAELTGFQVRDGDSAG